MSVDISGCHDLGVDDTTGIFLAKARDAAKAPYNAQDSSSQRKLSHPE